MMLPCPIYTSSGRRRRSSTPKATSGSQSLVHLRSRVIDAEKLQKETGFNSSSICRELKPSSLELYLKALRDGRETRVSATVMIVGHHGVGKSTLTQNLLGNDIRELRRTDSVEVHLDACVVSDGSWETVEELDHDKDKCVRLANVSIELLKSAEFTDSSEQPEASNSGIFDVDAIESDDSDFVHIDSEQTDGNSHDRSRLVSLSEKEKAVFEEHVGTSKVQRTMTLNIRDFGGQFIFYTTHPLFLSPNAVYILVLDLSKELDDTIVDNDVPKGSKPILRDVKSFCKFWMHSIHSFVGNCQDQPPVIFVGTHKDKVDEADKVAYQQRYFEAVKEIFHDTPAGKQIQPKTFFIDNINSASDEDLRTLKAYIVEVVKNQPFWKEDIPAKWILLEAKLKKMRSKKHITFNEVCTADSESEMPIKDKDELKSFLIFHHKQGTLVYIDEPALANFIVLDPQWIVDAFKCIITSESFCDSNPTLRSTREKLVNDATLETQLVEEVWKCDQTNDFFEQRNILLKFLAKHGVIARAKCIDEEIVSVRKLNHYIVPSLLQHSDVTDKTMSIIGTFDKTITLVFAFNSGFVSPTLYHRLTAAAVGNWAVVNYDGERLMYKDRAVYQLNSDHAGIIQVTDSTIDIRVVNLCRDPVDGNQSDRMRRFVELVLKHEHRFHTEPMYTYAIRCDHGDNCAKSVILVDVQNPTAKQSCLKSAPPHVIEVENNLRKWFKKEQATNTVTRDQLERVPTEKELGTISTALGMNWEILGLASLGLTSAEIDRCKLDHPYSTINQIFYMLLSWQRREGNNATFGILLQAMEQNECVNINYDVIRNVIDRLEIY